MTVYMRKHLELSTVLECDDDFVPTKELAVLEKAFYVCSPIGYVGVYASPIGPIFFVNDEKYPMVEGCWRIAVTRFEDENEVVMEVNGVRRFAFRYPKVEVFLWDPWSEEAFDDFYIWLASRKENAEFILMWTL